jgi:PadR family transcriptional regulator PadR
MSSTESAVVQLRRGVLSYCVVAMITDGERYGLDLVNELVELGLASSEGTIYPLLARLRRDGLVTSRWEESVSGPPRRYYAATRQGREAVEDFRAAWTALASSVDKALRTR